ncbi:sensor histidine kinase [Rhizomicrobium electricum]|uniref:histidine kinase n=1 Tax=Rhizomicrobium electricum TaxID=480070 RepID=A0ABP3PHT9_9PROT|nr:HAMP domain-containing sensor histidine kinase [Rhizomicrobium electricum]NIJ48326.1 signal transduction histidine kinase [Rhizomicrobium electricum]
MHGPSANGKTRSERILAEKLELLYRTSAAILTNFVISCVVAWLLSDFYPHWVLAWWLAAVGAVCAARLMLLWRFHRTSPETRCSPCAARRFTLGALASGMLWGAICLGLPVWGDAMDYIVLAVTAAGMVAGAVSTISVYFPSYLCYSLSFAIPLTTVSILHRDVDIAGAGAMMVIYYAAISLTAWRTNRFIAATAELSVDNQLLKTSLDKAHGERDAARTDKWSTLAQLSHELRTPLNAILGFSEAMHGEIFGKLGHTRYKEYAEHVLTSGRDLLTLTEELLLLSQGESGTLSLKETEIDAGEVIRSLIDLKAATAGRAGLELQAYIASDLPLLKADTAKLRQMLLNLIDNAIKFTPSGGEVSVTAAVRDGSIVLKVSDTGIGMDREQVAIALEPFGRIANALTNNTAGAGLGLPICKRLAELHEAALAIETAPGRGTSVTITFPPVRTVSRSAAAAA